MTNRKSAGDYLCHRRLSCLMVLAVGIVGCAEKSSSELRVDPAAAKALRAKLLGDEAAAERSSQ